MGRRSLACYGHGVRATRDISKYVRRNPKDQRTRSRLPLGPLSNIDGDTASTRPRLDKLRDEVSVTELGLPAFTPPPRCL